jgi:hypothetical protein
MNEADLVTLRKTDPFMYYSIPSVIKAFRSNLPVDHSALVELAQGDAGAGGQAQPSTVVKRQTRISDGCDYITVMSEMINMATG